MRRLICSAEVRLGQNGIEDFRNHPWFSGVDWSVVTEQTAPYIPEVSSPTDTSNFDVDDNDIRQSDAQPPAHNPAFSALHLPFVGFSFTQGSRLSDLGGLNASEQPLPICNEVTDQLDGLSKSAYERRISRLEDEKKELLRKLNDSNRALQNFAHGPIDNDVAAKQNENSATEELRDLKDEVNRLTKTNDEMTRTAIEMDQQAKELASVKRDLEIVDSEKSSRLKELEKQCKNMRLEKEDTTRELTDAQEKLKLQSKELKDAVQQRKLAMSEYAEVTDKLSELRQQKQKLSRQVRDKEEELENSLQKIDTLRQDIRKAEKLRRELELRAEEAVNESVKDRKSREKLESQSKQLEKDLSAATAKASASSVENNSSEGINHDEFQHMQQDITKLNAEIEKLEISSQESLVTQQTKHNQELSTLRERLDEGERQLRQSEMDMATLREKLDKTRIDSLQESEETMSEFKSVYEREKSMLLEENKKLQFELERSLEISNRLQLDRRQFEEEYQDLRNKKEAVAQWEAQISEIINW
jgi:serine/threonine-protein kinase MRCK